MQLLGFRVQCLGCIRMSYTRFMEKQVHGWDRIKNVHFYSSLGLSTHKNVKCYPAMTKERGFVRFWGALSSVAGCCGFEAQAGPGFPNSSKVGFRV